MTAVAAKRKGSKLRRKVIRTSLLISNTYFYEFALAVVKY